MRLPLDQYFAGACEVNFAGMRLGEVLSDAVDIGIVGRGEADDARAKL